MASFLVAVAIVLIGVAIGIAAGWALASWLAGAWVL